MKSAADRTKILAVPFNEVRFSGNENAYLKECIERKHISGDGAFTHKCHDFLEKSLGIGKALLTTSCTDALEMSALLMDLKPGDEVIMPSFTFVSTANAYVLRGAVPVFVDIRRDTLNIDENLIDAKITTKTKAIVVVHYAGVACEMEAIASIAKKHGLFLIEDNAHGLFGQYRGRNLGTFGDMATLSFHETKNFSCGEGGALLINNSTLFERAEIIREKGTNRARFFRGQIDKYSWVDIGSSFLPADLNAAVLLAQLEQRTEIQSARQKIWNKYATELYDWANDLSVSLPTVPEDCEHPAHLFYMILRDLDTRQAFIAHLRANGIAAVFHYLPLHLSDMGRRLGGTPGDCPVTEEISDRLVRLPLFAALSITNQEKVILAIQDFKR